MRRVFLAAACAAALLPFAAPRASAQGTATTMRIALREDADILDPTLGLSYVGRIVFAGLCDKLFDIDEKLNIVPQLATGYEWADPKTLVIHLRPNVQFQDGEKLDAEAVKYSLMRHLTMQGSFRKSEISAMDSVEVVDPLTVKVHLKQPSSPFVAALADRAGMIVAPLVTQKEGKDFGLHPVCAGPFSFVERVPQDRIVLQKFPGYWDAKDIHLDKVIYQPMAGAEVRVANLKSGNLEMSEQILPTDVKSVESDPKLKVVVSDSLGYDGITFNLGNGARADTPVGQNAKVRQAFKLAIDPAALTQVVYNGVFTPLAQAVPPSSPFYVPSVKPWQRDVDKAKALLKEAGVKTPLTVTMNVPNSPDIRQAAEVIQSMVSEAGFDLKLNVMEFASSLQAEHRGDFEAYLIGWSGRVDADADIYQFLHTGGLLNDGRYSNKDVDSLLEKAREITDVGQRRDLYAQVWQHVAQDVPLIYLWNLKNVVGMSKKVQGYRPIPDGIIRLQGVSLAQ